MNLQSLLRGVRLRRVVRISAVTRRRNAGRAPAACVRNKAALRRSFVASPGT